MNAATKAVVNWADGSTEEWFNDLLQIGYDYPDHTYTAAQKIREYVMDTMLADIEFGTFAGELVKLSFDDIDWDELARHYIESANS